MQIVLSSEKVKDFAQEIEDLANGLKSELNEFGREYGDRINPHLSEAYDFATPINELRAEIRKAENRADRFRSQTHTDQQSDAMLHRLKRFFYPGMKNKIGSLDRLYDLFPILEYYRREDALVNGIPGTDPSKYPRPSASPSLDIEWTFLGLSEPSEAIVFDGALPDDGDPEDVPSKVYRRHPQSIVEPYINPSAEIRRRRLEGAEALCDLESSECDTRRAEETREKLRLKGRDAQPCGVVEDTVKEIEPLSQLPDRSPDHVES